LKVVPADVVRIELEVRVVEESLVGRARAADGTACDFAGWLGLMTVLAALLPAQADEHGAERPEGPDPGV
jgi:hypothetical protein